MQNFPQREAVVTAEESRVDLQLSIGLGSRYYKFLGEISAPRLLNFYP